MIQQFLDFLTGLGLDPQTARYVLYGVIALIVLFVWSMIRKTGIWLLLIGGVGYWLVKNDKLDNAFNIEDGLSKISDVFKKFKDKQKNRYKATTANQTVVAELEKRLATLREDPVTNDVEIRVLEKEIAERKEFTDRLLNDDEFVVFGDDEDKRTPPQPVDIAVVTPMPLPSFEVYDPSDPVEIDTRGSGPGNIAVSGFTLFDA